MTLGGRMANKTAGVGTDADPREARYKAFKPAHKAGTGASPYERWRAKYPIRPTRTRWFFQDGCWATKDDMHAWDVIQPGVDGGQDRYLHESIDLGALMQVMDEHGYKDRLTGTSYGSDDER